MLISAAQIRAARGLLGLSQKDLVRLSGVSEPTIKRMENPEMGPGRSAHANVEAVRLALEQAGVCFIGTGLLSEAGGDGVRLTDVAHDEAKA